MIFVIRFDEHRTRIEPSQQKKKVDFCYHHYDFIFVTKQKVFVEKIKTKTKNNIRKKIMAHDED